MVDLLIETLETFGYPITLQGSIAENEEYPDSFFTFWNNNTDDSGFYDNEESRTIWDYDLNFYSNDTRLVNSKLIEAINLLKKKGFIADGKGHDVGSDEKTHTGRGVNLFYIERR